MYNNMGSIASGAAAGEAAASSTSQNIAAGISTASAVIDEIYVLGKDIAAKAAAAGTPTASTANAWIKKYGLLLAAGGGGLLLLTLGKK